MNQMNEIWASGTEIYFKCLSKYEGTNNWLCVATYIVYVASEYRVIAFFSILILVGKIVELKGQHAGTSHNQLASNPNVIGSDGNVSYLPLMYNVNSYVNGLCGNVPLELPTSSTTSTVMYHANPIVYSESQSSYYCLPNNSQVQKPSARYPMPFYSSAPPLAHATAFTPYFDRSAGNQTIEYISRDIIWCEIYAFFRS